MDHPNVHPSNCGEFPLGALSSDIGTVFGTRVVGWSLCAVWGTAVSRVYEFMVLLIARLELVCVWHSLGLVSGRVFSKLLLRIFNDGSLVLFLELLFCFVITELFRLLQLESMFMDIYAPLHTNLSIIRTVHTLKTRNKVVCANFSFEEIGNGLFIGLSQSSFDGALQEVKSVSSWSPFPIFADCLLYGSTPELGWPRICTSMPL